MKQVVEGGVLQHNGDFSLELSLNAMTETIERTYKLSGNWRTMMVLGYERHEFIFYVPMEDMFSEKVSFDGVYSLDEQMKEKLGEQTLQYAYLATETWNSRQDKVAPSKDPERVEGFIIMGKSIEGGIFARAYDLDRTGGHPQLIENGSFAQDIIVNRQEGRVPTMFHRLIPHGTVGDDSFIDKLI